MTGECLASLQLTFSITKEASAYRRMSVYVGMFLHLYQCVQTFAGPSLFLCCLSTCCTAGRLNKYIRCWSQEHIRLSPRKT